MTRSGEGWSRVVGWNAACDNDDTAGGPPCTRTASPNRSTRRPATTPRPARSYSTWTRRAGPADLTWINQQYNLGAFDEYPGEWIAVVGKTLLGHGRDPTALRARVAAETGHPPKRIITTFISRNYY